MFLTKIQSYAPLPLNAFVPKLIHESNITESNKSKKSVLHVDKNIPYYPERL